MTRSAIELVGLAEIAMRAGVGKSAVANWVIRHDDFPTPAAELLCGSVWFWPEVRDWLRETGRETDAGFTAEQVSSNENVREKRELVGLTEIAQRAGVQKPAVAMWRTRHKDFPAPVDELHTGAVWRWGDVRNWLVKHGRRTDAGWTVEQVNASAIRRRERDHARAGWDS